jgi:hypothetical protein
MRSHCIMKILITLLVLPQLTSAQGNLVVNGDFGTDASDWTLINGAFYNGLYGNPAGSVNLYGGPITTASQEINSLITGQLYLISGDYQGNGEIKDTITNNFAVAIDGVVLFETAAPPDLNWHSFNFEYTATSANVLLTLSAQLNGSPDGDHIDNIAMYATPEPSASSLIFLGGGLLIYVHKRHWHTAQTRPPA